MDKTPGKILAELHNATKRFGENTIIENANIEIERGDKIALIGANGKGKSTLLRMIAGVENLDGERKWGHNVEESFYAQHQLEALNLNNTILEEMRECGSQMTDLELRVLLGCFLFSGDDADKRIKILSGGEKARVALAKVIVSKANFLMLDEPTNHLDMHSCDLMIEALNKYQGSFILVSHDRYFVSKTANKIWEIVDHEIKEFKGGYEEWVEWKERMKARDAGKDKKTKEENPAPKQVKAPEPEKKQEAPKQNIPINKDQKKELQKVQKQFQQLEQRIAELNRDKQSCEEALADPSNYSDKQKFLQTEEKYKKTQTELTRLHAEYEKVFEKMMELEGS